MSRPVPEGSERVHNGPVGADQGGEDRAGDGEGSKDSDQPVTQTGEGPAEAPWPDEPLALWEGVGVEIEMMIVDSATLDVRPVADHLMEAASGVGGGSDVERGAVAWSNELALHVLELKTNGPARELAGLPDLFHANVREASAILDPLGCRLMPGGMHPWMDPERELRLWPHEYTDVYRAFDRIFSCRGHGWANLQSTHVNLPFRGDREFAPLHEAIRLVLPLVPALAASSPFLDGRPGPMLDNRLVAYRGNARRIPSVTGRVVPERISSRAAYQTRILERIYHDLEPHDPEGILRDEWVNARGAIARFGRGSIEIRLLDAQECPTADLAVVAAVVGAVRWLSEGILADGDRFDSGLLDDSLVRVLDGTIAGAGEAEVADPRYLRALGLPSSEGLTVREVWHHLLERSEVHEVPGAPWSSALDTILREGTLAERLRQAAGLSRLPYRGSAVSAGESRDGVETVPQSRLNHVYEELCRCLERDRLFSVSE